MTKKIVNRMIGYGNVDIANEYAASYRDATGRLVSKKAMKEFINSSNQKMSKKEFDTFWDEWK